MKRLLVLNPNTNSQVTGLIERQARTTPLAGMTVCVGQVAWGAPSIETRIDAAIATVAVIDTLAGATGYDGVLIAAFGDPGLLAARELLAVPVAGIGESALAAASRCGTFAILTIQPTSVPLVQDLVHVNRCADRCVAIDALPVSVLQAADPAAIADQLAVHAEHLARTHRIDCLVLGGAPLGVHAAGIQMRTGLRCIDPIAAGIQRWASMAPHAGMDSPYTHLHPKPFVGDFEFIPRINRALWPSP